jgi:hypothetical protein
MRRASIIKFIKWSLLQRDVVLTLTLLGLALSSGLSAAAQPKKEPLPASIEAAKAGPYVKTSLDPKPTVASNAKEKEGDKKAAAPPLPKMMDRDKTSLPVPPATNAAPSPAPAPAQGDGISALLKGPQNKGKYIKIPAANVDLTPPPPPPAPEKGPAKQDTQTPPSDQARKTEADSVINDLEDLAVAPPPPPQRDSKTGNIMLPNKSRTVVVEKGSVVLDSSALKTIIEAQNRDDLVAYGNTMGKSLSENLRLLSQFYPFTLTVGGSAAPPIAAPRNPAEETLPPSDGKKPAKKSKKPRPEKKG